MLAMLVLLLLTVVRLPAMTWDVLRMSATAATDVVVVVVVVPSVYSLIQSSLAACSSLFVCSTAAVAGAGASVAFVVAGGSKLVCVCTGEDFRNQRSILVFQQNEDRHQH